MHPCAHGPDSASTTGLKSLLSRTILKNLQNFAKFVKRFLIWACMKKLNILFCVTEACQFLDTQIDLIYLHHIDVSGPVFLVRPARRHISAGFGWWHTIQNCSKIELCLEPPAGATSSALFAALLDLTRLSFALGRSLTEAS
jgi:hypothetical protein